MYKLDVAHIRTANPLAVKQVNRTVVLNLIRQLQPISRAELAEVSGLNRSTVTDIVKSLLDEELLLETGFKESRGGRRAIQLRLNAANMRCVVVEVGVGQSSIFLGDVDGGLEQLATIRTPRDPGAFVAQCTKVLDGVLKLAPPGAFRGIGVSFPGLVDSVSGRVLFAPNLGWRDVELGSSLSERYSLPVFLENEANLCAVAEMWFGMDKMRGEASFAFVSVTEGIGVGIVIDNRLYRGVNGTAGEFGHMTVEREGPQCGCGNRGCWETLASELAAARKYAGVDSGFTGNPEVSFADVLVKANAGEERARTVLAQMGRYLSLGIANIVNGLDLKTVIVGGKVTQAWEIVGPAIHDEVVRHILPASAAGLRVEPSDIAGANVMGALIQAVSPVFSGVTLH